VRKADNLPPSCAVVTKSGNLNFLELSGPFQACNGTALPLPLHPYSTVKLKFDSQVQNVKINKYVLKITKKFYKLKSQLLRLKILYDLI